MPFMAQRNENAFETARRFGFRPPIVALLSLLIALGAEQLWPARGPLPPTIGLIAAAILWTAAGGLGVSALRLFHHRRTTHDPFGKPSTLAITGPYRVSRNPMYLGVAFILLGAALARGTLAPLAAPLLFVVVVDTLFIRHEEQLLKELFNEEYHSYLQRVRRWL